MNSHFFLLTYAGTSSSYRCKCGIYKQVTLVSFNILLVSKSMSNLSFQGSRTYQVLNNLINLGEEAVQKFLSVAREIEKKEPGRVAKKLYCLRKLGNPHIKRSDFLVTFPYFCLLNNPTFWVSSKAQTEVSRYLDYDLSETSQKKSHFSFHWLKVQKI